MQRIIGLVVIAVALAGVWWWMRPGGGVGDEGPSYPREFVDPAGYRLTVPAGWTLADHARDNALIRADLSRGKGGVQVRLETVGRGTFESFTERAIAGYRRDIAGHWKGVITEIDRGEPTVGRAALTVRFRMVRKNDEVWYLQQSFVTDGRAVVHFQGGSPWDDQSDYRDALDGIVTSVRFESSKTRD